MTTQIGDIDIGIAQAAPAGVGGSGGDVGVGEADARALQVARELRDAFDVECVILFGSRARGDWTERSDIDLMIIEPDTSVLVRLMDDIQRTAWDLAELAYQGEYVGIDFVYLARDEYERKSRHTLNHVARFARRDGIAMSRNPEGFIRDDRRNYEVDSREEPDERGLRIAHANMHYRAMHGMMDIDITDRITAYNAHQTLEHAMKALISAQGYAYRHVHELGGLLAQIRAKDPALNWRPVSDLNQLTNFAGGNRYGPLLTPIYDYTEMANRVTDDLRRIYEEIARLTGENPWAVPPEGSDAPIEPRYRQESPP